MSFLPSLHQQTPCPQASPSTHGQDCRTPHLLMPHNDAMDFQQQDSPAKLHKSRMQIIKRTIKNIEKESSLQPSHVVPSLPSAQHRSAASLQTVPFTPIMIDALASHLSVTPPRPFLQDHLPIMPLLPCTPPKLPASSHAPAVPHKKQRQECAYPPQETTCPSISYHSPSPYSSFTQPTHISPYHTSTSCTDINGVPGNQNSWP